MLPLFPILLIALIVSACSYAPTGDGASPPQSASGPPSKSGDAIIDEYLRRDNAPFRRQRVRFTITSEDEPVKIYEVDTWRKQTESETVTLTQIVKPAEDSDLASLTIEKNGEPAIVTSFVASQNTFRETDTGKMFFGGLTAGELLGEWNKFDFILQGEKELDGARIYELEGKIKKGRSSVSSRMLVLMRAAEPIPVEIKLFDAGEKQIRTYKVTETKTDTNGTYAARTEIENPIYKSTIVVEVLDREFPASLDVSTFTRDKLKEIAIRKK